MELRGRAALVTGAARRIGRAIALELGHAGADVVVHYGRSRDEAEGVADELRDLGVSALPLSADLSDTSSIDTLFAEVSRSFGRLDLLVNSAAGFRRQSVWEIDADDWDEVLDVNLKAPFLCSKLAAQLMRESSRPADVPGLIVNMADLSGVQAWRWYAHHGVSKAGLLHLTKVLAREFAPEVRVNAIVPGPILPPPGMDVTTDAWTRAGERVPLQRTGKPQHIAHTVRFLAENDYVTGAAIPVDGGEHLIGPRGR